MLANAIDPIEPEIVLFGLILVNFGPFIFFPTTYPPISEAIHPIRRKNKINLDSIKLKKNKIQA